MAFGLIGAAVGAGTSLLGARSYNRALSRAASEQARLLAFKHLDDRQRRAEEFGQLAASVRVVQGASGGVGIGSAALNFGELLESAAGDARTDIGILDREYRTQLESLRSEVASQSKNVLLETVQGAMQGFQIGSSIGSSFKTLFPVKGPASLPVKVSPPSPGSRPNALSGMNFTPMRLPAR